MNWVLPVMAESFLLSMPAYSRSSAGGASSAWSLLAAVVVGAANSCAVGSMFVRIKLSDASDGAVSEEAQTPHRSWAGAALRRHGSSSPEQLVMILHHLLRRPLFHSSHPYPKVQRLCSRGGDEMMDADAEVGGQAVY